MPLLSGRPPSVTKLANLNVRPLSSYRTPLVACMYSGTKWSLCVRKDHTDEWGWQPVIPSPQPLLEFMLTPHLRKVMLTIMCAGM